MLAAKKNNNEPSNEELLLLIDQIQCGSETSWRRFWSLIEPSLLPLVRKPSILGPLARSADHRADVLQELAIGLYTRIGKCKEFLVRYPEARPIAWLTVVAKNICTDYVRRQGRAVQMYDASRWVQLAPIERGDGDGHILVLRPAGHGQGRDMMRAFAIMNRARSVLSPHQYQALTRWIRGQDSRQSRAARAALARLRRLLSADAGE